VPGGAWPHAQSDTLTAHPPGRRVLRKVVPSSWSRDGLASLTPNLPALVPRRTLR
jgi:hypothetical protein